MKYQKTQMQRIFSGFVTCVILILGATLVASGIAVSKINTDYLETGIEAGKIVAERKAQRISLTTHDGLTLTGESDPENLKKILPFLPSPLNTGYYIFEEIDKMLAEEINDVATKPK